MGEVERKTVSDPKILRNHNHNAVRLRGICFDGGEGWSRYLWIDRAEALEHYRELRQRGYDILDAYHEAVFPNWSSGYRGPGRSFSTIPERIKGRSRKWIVWTQTGGMDV